MAKRGTPDHPKTKRLAKALKVPFWAAVGLLETTWQWVSRYCPSGFISAQDMEILEEYLRVENMSFPEILIGNGWLDMVGNGYYIHDWHDHADDATKKVLEKRKERFANGSPVRGITAGTGNEPELAIDSLPPRDPLAIDSRQPKPKPKPYPEPQPEPYPNPSFAPSAEEKPDSPKGVKSPRKVSVIPTVEEVIAYGKEIGLPESECKAFWFYYDSKDWKRGKEKIQKWKSALSGWKTRWESNPRSSTSDQPKIYTKAEREARKLAQGELDEF